MVEKVKEVKEKIKEIVNGGITAKKMVLVCLIVMAMYSIVSWSETWYWKYYPFDPAKIYEFSIPTEPGKMFGIKILNPGKMVYPGGEVLYQVDMDKKMSIAPVVKVEQRNTFSYIMSPYVPPIRPLGRQKVAIPISVPRMAEYGKYTIYWTAEYPIGPNGRTVSRSTISEPYWVILDPNDLAELKGDTGATGLKGDTGKTGAKGATGKNFWGK